MHGRIKTYSSEEQKEKQRKAREVKMKMFTAAMEQIFEKRRLAQTNDEIMKIIQDVLINNPNIITLWNIRREILLEKENPEENFQSELLLTEQCLKSDPKSYGTWHHRFYILDKMPDEVWGKELKLCDKLLSLDERNFHCWDYRKMVVDRARISPEDVYNYTTTKIEANFSNYSAWHFRSKVLPKLFTDPEGKYPLEESKHKEELELVQNACFTDPDDQSAWFYQRWLLNLTRPPLSFLWAQILDEELHVAFTRTTFLDDVTNITVECGGEGVVVEGWHPLSGRKSSTVWKTALQGVNKGDILTIKANFPEVAQISCNYGSSPDQSINQSSPILQSLFQQKHSSDVIKTFEQQLSSCNELLTIEPDSKWTLLTATFLMNSMNPKKYFSKITENLAKLVKVDSFRKNYYADLMSKICIEIELKVLNRSINLSKKGLHCLYHTQYFGMAKMVDLCENNLLDFDLKNLYPLVNCTDLRLDNNLLTNLKSLPRLQYLKTLSAVGNPLVDLIKDREYVMTFPSFENAVL